MAVAISGDGQTVLAGDLGGGLARSTTGGATFERVTSVTGAEEVVISGDGATAAAFASSALPTPFWSSQTGGATWNQVTSYTPPLSEQAFSYVVGSASTFNGNALWAVGHSDSLLWGSSDFGISWTVRVNYSSQADTLRPFRVATSADGALVVVTLLSLTETGNCVLAISTDGGTSWSNVDPDGDAHTNSLYSSVAVSADGRTIVAAVYAVVTSTGVSGGHLYYSIDGGATWTTVGPQGFWRVVTMTADGKHLAAIESAANALYLSSDFVTWTQAALTPGQNFFLDVAYAGDGSVLVAATAPFSGNVWLSYDHGATWKVG